MRMAVVGTTLALFLSASWIIADDEKPPKQCKPVRAATLEFNLKRLSLQGSEDAGGLWQYEGGQIVDNGKHVANYASVRRVVKGGTDEQNTAMLTTTIFFLGAKPPENMTLQGSHDFNSGKQAGSVSAASKQYSAFIGKAFSSSGTNQITIK